MSKKRVVVTRGTDVVWEYGKLSRAIGLDRRRVDPETADSMSSIDSFTIKKQEYSAQALLKSLRNSGFEIALYDKSTVDVYLKEKALTGRERGIVTAALNKAKLG